MVNFRRKLLYLLLICCLLFPFSLLEMCKKRSVLDNLPNNSYQSMNGWTINNCKYFPVGPVYDERWDDFPVEYNISYQRFDNLRSLSFSLISSEIMEVTFYANDEESLDYFTIKYEEDVDTWQNFSVIIFGKTIQYFQNYSVIRTYNLVPSQVVIRTSINVNWKIHNYTMGWTTTDTDGESTLLQCSSGGSSILLVYAVLCEDCYLNVSIVDEQGVTYVPTSEKFPWKQTWQNRSLNLTVTDSTYVNITRYYRNSGKNVDKFWGLDARLICEPKYQNSSGGNISETVALLETNRGMSDGMKKIETMELIICAAVIITMT